MWIIPEHPAWRGLLLWDGGRPGRFKEAMDEALKESTVPESIHQAGLGYEGVFDTSPGASGVEALR